MVKMLHFLQILLLVALTQTLLLLVNSQEPAFNDEVLGLIAFKAGLQDPKAKLTSWNEEDDDPCHWNGVKCEPGTNRVAQLLLDAFSLSGHISSRGLLRLQMLQTLSLSNNNFTGTINPDLAHFPALQVIDFSENSLSGSIPHEFFLQCGSLRVVSLARNNLTGQVPDSLGSCSNLAVLNFSSNWLSGKLPSGIWSLRSLQSLDLSDNFLEGDVFDGIGTLYDLRVVNFARNQLSGPIPGDIGDCLTLKIVDFGDNWFTGSLPGSLQRLSSCTSLSVQGNSLTGFVPDWIGDMSRLESLDLSANNFTGWIPFSIGNLQHLKELNLSRNKLSGALPDSISKCDNLLSIDISQNRLTGSIPSWISKLSLEGVLLSGNRVSGSTIYPPLSMAATNQGLQVLDLSSNSIIGEIPSNIGDMRSLVVLNMSRNQLSGPIPVSIDGLKKAELLDLSYNRLNGSLPSEIGGAVLLKELRLERNFLTGKIPTQIENCTLITSLSLSQNNLSGPIPKAIANLSDLQVVDLSWNGFSGSLPKELINLSHIVLFNISHNRLEGELPVGGYFNTITPSSVGGNPSLCGAVVNRSCPANHQKPIVLNPNSSSEPAANYRRKKIVLSISSLIAIGAAAFIAIGVLAVSLLNIHARSSMSRPTGGEGLISCSPDTDPNYGKLVMFSGDAEFVAGAHALLNKDCELGRGGFGVVYRTVLRDGRSVAIKKLTMSSLIKSQEDFEREMRNLGTVRHDNVVALEGYYWTPSLQLLIHEYVSSGSLHKHLHDGGGGNWRERFNVILGMARGLAHLHGMGIIHYNLKSTNVLIDDESGEAKVGDFGLARLLPMSDRCILSSKIQSALGYMAPEFACRTVKITEKCDVYGFGVLVLEVVTGKRPVEYMEDDVVVLCDMVRGALEDGRVHECVDGRLSGDFPADEAIPLIKLGLVCASQVPSNRPDMDEVVNILQLIQCPCEEAQQQDFN
ncbi:leucine-rich repeat receptor-like protein kinase PXC2 [Rutidosis leptorrhynchoides]|uniref:leucine-rich repeat receptor-like protein kinase PXC2 n=1 Tax=Rutidosis leptorrhynchoides TaxID=125765 RepID=UPI003A994BB1